VPTPATAAGTAGRAEAGAAEDAPILPNYVGGEWVEAEASGWLEDIDPASGRTLARVPLSAAGEVDRAVRAARAAQPSWAAMAPQRRARAILKLRERLEAAREEISVLVSRDMGKGIDQARAEVGRGLESVEAASAVPHLLKGASLEGVASGVDVAEIRQPVGVVAAITPFNFPAMIPLWFLPFALATGNAFILKPSERDPLPSRLILELIDGIDEIPAGVANLVHGGREAVDGLLDHPGIDAISFVGQASTARHIVEGAGRTGKRVQALGGAKNSIIVMPDADLAASVPAIIESAFGSAGQRCLAGSVAVVVGDEERRAEVRRALVEAAAAMRIGPGEDPASELTPLVSAEARERVADGVARAERDGARMDLDGRGERGPAGTVLGATIMTVADRESELAREELFGPLLAVVEAGDLDDALGFVNGSRYGNAAAIFTESGRAARRFRAEVEAGMVGVNIGVPAPVAWFPFAGWKDSFIGDLHANGDDAIAFYTRKKVITSRWH
jgi:malonate-semialdehyde dehydrogenase (acetylating)/methylmalonate-semialdehyde dehydrogenase